MAETLLLGRDPVHLSLLHAAPSSTCPCFQADTFISAWKKFFTRFNNMVEQKGIQVSAVDL